MSGRIHSCRPWQRLFAAMCLSIGWLGSPGCWVTEAKLEITSGPWVVAEAFEEETWVACAAGLERHGVKLPQISSGPFSSTFLIDRQQFELEIWKKHDETGTTVSLTSSGSHYRTDELMASITEEMDRRGIAHHPPPDPK